MGQTISMKQNSIDDESKLVYLLIHSAKVGNFKTVWKIIGEPNNPKNGHLINCIPDARRWGVLHQAVYWRDPWILRKMLSYPACDKYIRAKFCTSECGETGQMNAERIAKQYGYNEIAEIIEKYPGHSNEKPLPTFQEDTYMGLIATTLAAYKSTFHPECIDPSKSIVQVLSDIFQDIQIKQDRFRKVQKHVCDSLSIVTNIEELGIEGASETSDFFERVIKPYTTEDNQLYMYLSTAFRRAMHSETPTGDDLALGPYAAMYQMILLFWTRLESENKITYRKMSLATYDVNKYKKGTKFYWPSVVSSSVNKENANIFPTSHGATGENSVLFTIDNSQISLWQPKNIEDFAAHKEYERTYPAGAKFRVTKVHNSECITEVYLTLLRQGDDERMTMIKTDFEQF